MRFIFKALLFGLLCLGPVFSGDLGIGLYSTDPLGVAPTCNTPVLLQSNPSCAFGTSVYMVVWSDGSKQSVKAGADIYCARVEKATGRILDSAGIRVCHADYIQDYPRVAFDGTNFLVVWADFRSNRDFDVFGARVTEAGVSLDADGFAIAAKPGINEAWPVVAYANGNYFVAWTDSRYPPTWGLYGARVGTDGTVMDPNSGIGLDTVSSVAIEAARPPKDRVNGTNNNWPLAFPSITFPSLASNGKVCGISYTGKGTMLGTIDAQTGKFIHAPTQIFNNGTKSALTATSDGWAVTIHYGGTTGWTSDTRFEFKRYDSLFVQKLDIAVNMTTLVQGTSTSTQRFGDGFGGRGAWFYLTPAVGWITDMPVGGMDMMWNLLGVGHLMSTLYIGRPPFTSGVTDTLEKSWDKYQEVARPYFGNGPNECLLVYERVTGVNNCQVMSRIIRKP